MELHPEGAWLRFFFSSRRRHTSSLRDWSSDVCSSDLMAVPGTLNRSLRASRSVIITIASHEWLLNSEIGRASCRDRVYIAVVAERGKIRERRGWSVRRKLRMNPGTVCPQAASAAAASD